MKLRFSLSVNFTLYLVVFFRFISSQHECFRRNSGGIEQFCCDNYVKINGICVECETGSKSKNEQPCIPCIEGTYGRRCGHLCKCNMNERCDRIIGCVLEEILSTSVLGTNQSSFGMLGSVTQTAANFNEYRAGENASNNKEYDNKVLGTNQSSFGMLGSVTQTAANFNEYRAGENATNNKEYDNKASHTKTEIFVYSAGSSSIMLLISVLCFCCVRFYKNNRKIYANGRISGQDNHTRNETNSCDEESSVYDSINEDEIYDDNIQIIYSGKSTEFVNNQTSDSDRSSLKSESSSYLHPYTTVTTDFETHTYCTQIKSYDSSSSSSVIDDMKRDSGYTHPYQQMKAVKSVELKSEYSKLVQYLELIDITIPSIVSKSLPNKTIRSSLKLSDRKEYDVGLLCPVYNSPCVINKNNIHSCQPVDLRCYPLRYCSSFPTFDQRENTGVDNKKKSSNGKHMSV